MTPINGRGTFCGRCRRSRLSAWASAPRSRSSAGTWFCCCWDRDGRNPAGSSRSWVPGSGSCCSTAPTAGFTFPSEGRTAGSDGRSWSSRSTAGLFLLGLRWGPAGVAVACVASYWILAVPALWYAGRPARFRFAASSKPCGGSSSRPRWQAAPRPRSCVGSLPRSSSPARWQRLMRIAIVSSVFGALYLGAVILLHRGYAPLSQLSALIREMVPRAAFSKSSAAGVL